MIRYQRAVLQALVDLCDAPGHHPYGATVNEVREQIVGTQTSNSVRGMLNEAHWRGHVTKHHYAGPRGSHRYTPTDLGRRRLQGETR